MKIAVCFSGQLRFVNEYSKFIIDNLIKLYDTDVYAHMWYDESTLGKPFHHDFNDLYKEKIEDFVRIYNPKKMKIEEKYMLFDENYYKYISQEFDLFALDNETIKNAIFRTESQWYSVFQTYNLIDTQFGDITMVFIKKYPPSFFNAVINYLLTVIELGDTNYSFMGIGIGIAFRPRK
jgi:hypothetical protein